MKLDILAFGAHPDDVELACCGTLLHHIKLGYKVGIVDLTRGELGTRGSAELRDAEAANSAKLLGVSVRENLRYADGFFSNDKEHQLGIIRMLRKYKPEIVFCNAVKDRHIDHGRGSALVSDACFLSGLIKIDTQQEAWRPRAVYHYIQDRFIKPDFCVDITPYWEQKMAAIMAFKSQFYDPQSTEPVTAISSPEFLKMIEARAISFGRDINAKYAEGFTVERVMGVGDVMGLG